MFRPVLVVTRTRISGIGDRTFVADAVPQASRYASCFSSSGQNLLLPVEHYCEEVAMNAQELAARENSAHDGVIQDSVIGIYPDFATAQAGIQKLHDEGFGSLQISLVGRDPAASPEVRDAAQYGDETETGALAGATVGGSLGALAGVTALTVTGIGPVIAAGAIATGITGAIVGTLIGAFQGWGIHEDHLQNYEDMIKAGRCLVVVQGDAVQVAKAYGTLNTTDALEVQMHARMSDDSPEIDDRPLPRSPK
jgi:hypothetical protein